MLILAAVTIGAITGNGIFSKAKYATELYNNSVNNEETLTGELEDMLNNAIQDGNEGADSSGSNDEDIAKPVTLTLNGANPMPVNNGIYVEPGYSAMDANGKDITDKVIVTSTVVQNQIGSYLVKYTINDKNGIAIAEETRTVNITDVIQIVDGVGYSGTVPLTPLTGNITMTGYNNWPVGFATYTVAEGGFSGTVFDGRTVWLTPAHANMVVGIDTITGVMKGYTNFPSGFSKESSVLMGGIDDGQNIWMIAPRGEMIIKLSGE